MIKKSRFVLALGLTLALGLGAYAFGDAASDATEFVDGAVNPTNAAGAQPTKVVKLDKSKAKPVALYTGVRTQAPVTGTQANPIAENISFGKNVVIDTNAVPQCTTIAASGSTPDQAKASCPKDSYLGSGTASLAGPGGSSIKDVVVTAFAGTLPGTTGKNGVLLHTYSPTLQTAAPTVQGFIVNSTAGSKYKFALNVPNAPETGALMIDSFGSNISKASKTVLATCKSKTFLWLRATTYKDGSKATSTQTQPCKAKPKH
ncbi:MAG: hypothetical protein QOI10_75 [Solirubrobacterales bacterium]|nr:hypothetical protein [Solirubrobacterales bacterium]